MLKNLVYGFQVNEGVLEEFSLSSKVIQSIPEFISFYEELGDSLRILEINLCDVKPIDYAEHIYHDKVPPQLVYVFQVNNSQLHEYNLEFFKKRMSKGIKVNMTQIEQIHFGLKQIRLALLDLYGKDLAGLPVLFWPRAIKEGWLDV